MAPEPAGIRVVKRLHEIIGANRIRSELCGGIDVVEDQLYREVREAYDKKDPFTLSDLANELEFLSRMKLELCAARSEK